MIFTFLKNQKVSRPKWHWIYYALAGFNIIAISISLFLNHQIIDGYEYSVQQHRLATNRMVIYHRLASAASEMNAPGNNIFETEDVGLERQHLNDAQQKFASFYDFALLECKQSKTCQNPDLGEFETIENFHSMKRAMEQMSQKTEQIFQLISKKQMLAASQLMANMDRDYALFLKNMTQIYEKTQNLELKRLAAELFVFQSLRNMEYGLMAFIFLMVIGTAAYGQNLEKAFKQLFSTIEHILKALNHSTIVAITDRAGKIRYVNQKFLDLSQYSESELLGQDHRVINSGYHSKQFMKNLWNTILSGQIWQGEICNRSKDGSLYWVNTTIMPVKDNLQDQAFISIRHDITEQKRIELALEKNISRFQLMLQASNDGYWDWDLISNEIYFSPRWKEQLGYTDEELPNLFSMWQSVILPEDRAASLRLVADYNQGRVSEFVMQQRFYHKNGSIVYVLSRAVHQKDASGQVIRMVGMHTDITELIKQKELAESASQAKGDFLANMSHEIRTPLNGVIGISSLLKETQLDAEQRDYIETLQFSAEHLLTLINDILDFSKIEAGKMEIEKRPFSLKELVNGIDTLVHQQVARKSLTNFVQVDPALNFDVIGDVNRIRQILLNFYSNALKFTKQGNITLDVSLLERTHSIAVVRLAVMDTGPGISPEKQGKIFEKFSQADASTTRVHGGTGLGLAICHLLSQLMQGEIGVESTPGEGSTFWVALPFEIQAIQLPSDLQEAIVDGVSTDSILSESSARILLVEDNAINQKVCMKMLEKLGFHAAVAGNGEEAVAMLAEDPYDMVLMDCQMPVMDGLEATRVIRKTSGPNQNIPIVALTANVMEGTRETCLEAGMNEYLSKPIRLESLQEMIQKILAVAKQPNYNGSLTS